jgi:oligopeptidase A
MRVHDYPQFSQITPQLAVTGCAKLAIEFDVQLGKHVDTLKEANYAKSFSNVFDPIEKLSVPLSYAWRTAKNLNYVRSADGFRAAFQRIHPQVERAKNERWINTTLYNAVKEVHADRQNLSEPQHRLVDMYLLEARLNGIELVSGDKKRFIEFLSKLVDAKNHYRNRVMLSHNLFSHTIDDFSIISEVPRPVLYAMAMDKSNPSRGPWRVTLNQNIYQPFLEYCGDRLTRWNVWQAFNNRSSIGQDEMNLSNHTVIESIRQHRRDIAKNLGYANFAEMSMETKMAGSVENVLGMIDSLRTKFQPLAEEEMNRLQEFARSEGFTDKLQMWDLPYWRRRHRQHLYKLDVTDVTQYFPYPHVISFLFEMCDNLFGVTVSECTSEVEVWHDDVRFYKIHDKTDGRHIASFYIDPYLRPSNKLPGTWMECGRERSEVMSTTPISYLNLNLSPPMGGQPSLMSFDQLGSLFYEFGHGLQQMLTTVPYSELAGQRNVEWDSLQTCANVMSMLLHHRHTLRALGRHHQTNQPMTDDLIDNILKVRHHMASYDIMRQLYFSAYDMEIYLNEEHWSRAMRRVWKEFMPLPLHEDDNHPCSFSAIFSDQYAAAYYSLKWSEMIAADIMKVFEEAGLANKDKVAAVGRKFRDTYLSLGGSVPADEVFRRFRGRDPMDDAFIERYLST